MSWLRRHKVKVLISSLIAAAFVWLLRAGALPFIPPEQALAAIEWWTIPVYVTLWSLVHLIRALRWRLLLNPIATVSVRKLLPVSMVGFAAIVILPMRTGEMVRPALIRERGKISGWSATGTVAAERIIDGLLLSLMLLCGLTLASPLAPLPDKIGDLEVSPALVPAAAYAALILFGGAFVALFAFYFARDWTRRALSLLVGSFSPRLSAWLSARIEKVAEGLKFLPQARYTVPFIGVTALYWLLNAGCTWLLALGIGLTNFGYYEACVLTGVLALGIMVPNAPGFFGAFQLSVYAALSLYFPETLLLNQGAVMVFLLYVCQLGIMFSAAAVSALVLGSSLRLKLSDQESLSERDFPRSSAARN